jgi:hypothetical protein
MSCYEAAPLREVLPKARVPRSRTRSQRYTGNEEATLGELLSDPIAELLRRRDRITLEQVGDFLEEAKRKLTPPTSCRRANETTV